MVNPPSSAQTSHGPQGGRLWRRPELWLALISFVAVVLIFNWEETHTVPTPISAVHAQDPELVGPDDCVRCHGEGEETLAQACFECHGTLEEQLRLASGFHGSLIEGDVERCGQCHIEHAGREFPLVGEHSFERAGFEGRDSFDHPLAGYLLDGAHLDLECVECHENADLALLLPETRRFQGLSQECLDCHDDEPHEGRMQRACQECHGQERPFAEIASFVHDERFELVGVHDLEDCKQCHEPNTPQSIEARASLDELPQVRGCEDCHESRHAPDFLSAVAQLATAPVTDRCTQCHLDQHQTFLDARAELTDSWHAASGYALSAPHDEPECAACHQPELDWAGRFPGRQRSECAACHEDPHRAQFATASEFRECHDCHLIDRFLPAAFDHEEHARTDFPLADSHRAVGCYSCHEPHATDPGDREWNRLDPRCSSCHEDSHGARFEARRIALAEASPSECSDCHQPTSFADAAEAFREKHLRWTEYPLEGAHGEIECVECHRPSEQADETGRSFGRIAEVWGALPTEQKPCASCHGDPHVVDFDLTPRPPVVDGRRGCARCHDEQSFASQPFGNFDHEQWTERHLGGSHLDLECHSCHKPTELPDSLGRRFGRVREVFGDAIDECATCHVDPHWGLFDGAHAPKTLKDQQGCARCHGELNFLDLAFESFDHDLWTDTDFQSEHKAQTCDHCHPKLREPGYGERGRREARGRRCDSCHVDPHAGQFTEAGVVDCRSCHEDQVDWSELVFDHQEDSRYPLDEIHEDLDCATCHEAYPQLGGPDIVRYKPLGIECIDCHPLTGGGPPDSGGDGGR